jgi:hypothetical protein
MRSCKHFALMLTTGLSVAACGGGGGGGGGGGPSTPTPPPPVAITDANANKVAALALASVDVRSLGDNGFPSGVVATAGNEFQVRQFLIDNIQYWTQPVGLGVATPVGAAVPPVTKACDSGTVVAGGTDGDGDGGATTVDVGDTRTLDFNQCVLNARGFTINGHFEQVLLSVDNRLVKTPPYHITERVTFGSAANQTNITVTSTGGVVTTYGGTFDFAFGTSDNTNFSGSVSVPSGNVFTLTQGAVTNTLYSLAENWSDIRGDPNAPVPQDNRYVISHGGGTITGQASSTAIGGSITFTVTTALSGDDDLFRGKPTAGAIRVDGLNGTNLTLTALPDGTNASIDVGSDGSAVPVPWTAL